MKDAIIKELFDFYNDEKEYKIFKDLSNEEKIISLIVRMKNFKLFGFSEGPFHNYNLGRAYYSDFCKFYNLKNIKDYELGFLIGYNENKYFVTFWYTDEEPISREDSRFITLKNEFRGFKESTIEFIDESTVSVVRYFNLDQLINWFDENIAISL